MKKIKILSEVEVNKILTFCDKITLDSQYIECYDTG